MERVCQDVLDVLDESLIPKAESGESKVFYHKMYVPYLLKINVAAPFTCILLSIHTHVGRETITVISQNLHLVKSARLRPQLHMKHIR